MQMLAQLHLNTWHVKMTAIKLPGSLGNGFWGFFSRASSSRLFHLQCTVSYVMHKID